MATFFRRLLVSLLCDGATARSCLASASSDHVSWSAYADLSSSRMAASALPTAAPAAVTPAATVLFALSKNCCGLGVRRKAAQPELDESTGARPASPER